MKKKQYEKFKSAKTIIQDYHERLWPNEPVELLKVKFAGKDNEDSQHAWFDRRTIPTSWLIAYGAYRLNFKYLNRADRAVAWQSISAMVATLLATTGPLFLPHKRYGDSLEVELQVSAQGTIDFSDLWTEQFFKSYAGRWWKKDRREATKPWVTTVYGSGARVSLADALTFLLDPQHSETFISTVADGCYALLTFLAEMIDANVVNMSSEMSPAGNLHKRKRSSNVLVRAQTEGAANRVWSGTVAQ